MFGHSMGNDPRPHYFHQTNIAPSTTRRAGGRPSTATGGTLYAVIDTLLEPVRQRRSTAPSTPLVQLSQDEAADDAPAPERRGQGRAPAGVTAYIQDGQVHIAAPAGTQVPVTGTTAGSDYAGTRSGWTTVDGAELVLAPQDPAAPRRRPSPAPWPRRHPDREPRHVGGDRHDRHELPVAAQRRRQHRWTNIAGATAATYTVPAADEANRLRVVVSAGNWISSVSQAASAAVTKPAPVPPPADNPPADNPPAANPPAATRRRPTRRPARPRLSRVRLAPRAFAVAGARTSRKGRRTGTTVRWTLDRAATVRLTVQQRAAKGKRWRTVGTLRRKARQGAGTLRFTGRLARQGAGDRALPPGGRRPPPARRTSSTKTVAFKVVRA